MSDVCACTDQQPSANPRPCGCRSCATCGGLVELCDQLAAVTLERIRDEYRVAGFEVVSDE